MISLRVLAFLACATVLGLPVETSGQQFPQSSEPTHATHSHAHELAGFLLRQDRPALEAVLGTPFAEEKRPSGAVACGYHLPGSRNNYLVAFYVQDKKSEMYGKIANLELTGTDPSGFTGFYGLELGDSAEKVLAILGKPTEVRHEDDVNVDLWDYQEENYSVEISPNHRLYSIQIVDQPGKDTPAPAGSNAVRQFAVAVEARDLDAIMAMASGELECSTSETFGIQTGGARAILSDPKSPISVCLKQAADAVLAFGPDMKGAEDELRVWERHSPGTVTKFPNSSPLAEVVFDEEAGAWRVYEVTFRAATK